MVKGYESYFPMKSVLILLTIRLSPRPMKHLDIAFIFWAYFILHLVLPTACSTIVIQSCPALWLVRTGQMSQTSCKIK